LVRLVRCHTFAVWFGYVLVLVWITVPRYPLYVLFVVRSLLVVAFAFCSWFTLVWFGGWIGFLYLPRGRITVYHVDLLVWLRLVVLRCSRLRLRWLPAVYVTFTLISLRLVLVRSLFPLVPCYHYGWVGSVWFRCLVPVGFGLVWLGCTFWFTLRLGCHVCLRLVAVWFGCLVGSCCSLCLVVVGYVGWFGHVYGYGWFGLRYRLRLVVTFTVGWLLFRSGCRLFLLPRYVVVTVGWISRSVGSLRCSTTVFGWFRLLFVTFITFRFVTVRLVTVLLTLPFARTFTLLRLVRLYVCTLAGFLVRFVVPVYGCLVTRCRVHTTSFVRWLLHTICSCSLVIVLGSVVVGSLVVVGYVVHPRFCLVTTFCSYTVLPLFFVAVVVVAVDC